MIKTELRRFMHLSLLVSILILLALLSNVYDFETIEQRYVSQKTIKSFFIKNGLTKDKYINAKLYELARVRSSLATLSSGDVNSVKFSNFNAFMNNDESYKSYRYIVSFEENQVEYLIVFKEGRNKISDLYIDGERLDPHKENVSAGPYFKKSEIEKITNSILQKYNDNKFEDIFNDSSEKLKNNGTRDQFAEYLDNVKNNFGTLNDIEIRKNQYDMKSQTFKIYGTAYSNKIQSSVSMVIWIDGLNDEKLSGIKFYAGEW